MKNKSSLLKKKREILKKRIKKKISGTPKRPRLLVYRGLKNLIAQLNDDTTNTTIISVDSRTVIKSSKELEKMKKTEISKEVGKFLAKKALEKNITEIVFDRSGYKYHGRVKALAEGAREGGLKF
jgi:large subunit ribosomal protein L18